MISVCMIVKGSEWEQTKRAIDSVSKYVDHFYITTTQEEKHPVYPKVIWSHYKWTNNFSEARNFNLKQCPDRYVMWLDSDDVVVNPQEIPEIVKIMNSNRMDAIYCDYNYEINEQGEVIIVHPRERIVINDGSYSWKGTLHETLISNRQVRTRYIKDIEINHYPEKEEHLKGIKRNLDIMMAQYQKERKEVQEKIREEVDPRTEFILARILFDLNEPRAYQRSAELFQDYLQHSGWNEEKAQAWNYLSRIFMHLNKFDDAVNCCLAAKKESPEYPTWDLMLANVYCQMGDFQKAEIYVTQALSLKQPKTALIVAPIDDKVSTLTALFLIAFNKKDLKSALEYAEGLYKLKPTEDYKKQVETVSELLKIGDWMKALGSMVEDMDGDYERIEKLLDSLPKKMENMVYLQQLRGAYLKPKVWSDKSIVYYAASDFENWSPKSLEEGIGGSEEAIIYLSKEWVKLGYEVTVYAKVGSNEGMYDGVQYLNYPKFNPHDHFNILIGWRNPLLFKYNLFSAKLSLLDLHDVPSPPEYTKDVLDRIDKIMVKSEFHRSLLPAVPDDKFIIIGNGIDVEKLKKVKGKKKRYKIFWGSSYDRGLENLLLMWPDIRKAEINAELHICYGWNLFDKVYESMPQMKKWRKQMEQLMTMPGITDHGRVGKDELYRIASECGVWAYSTEFEEIDCITARYTQALGTLPVVSNYAALKTTVKYGIKVDTLDGKHLNKDEYLKCLIGAIKHPVDTTCDAQTIMNEFNWTQRAKEWAGVFETPKKQDIRISVITPTIRTGFWNVMADNLSKQTYKNFEWIVCDDYKGNREDVAKKYSDKYNLDITYLRPPKRTAKVKRKYGLSSANNYAWKNAEGELCVWLQDFVLLEKNALESLVKVYRKNRYSFIAPVDRYYAPKVSPNLTNTEDWFDGDTNVVGKFMRENKRIGKGWLRESDTLYDLELNFGAIPKKLLEDLNGFWEFFDEALGYDDTEIVYRGKELGATLIVDERNICKCIDHWEPLKDKPEELGDDRIHNLNDPRFVWMANQMEQRKLSVKRDQSIDDNITLKYEIPKELDQDQAVAWMKEHLEEIVKGWNVPN